MIILTLAVIAIMLGLLVFKLTWQMFSISIRLIAFGITATLFFVPAMLLIPTF